MKQRRSGSVLFLLMVLASTVVRAQSELTPITGLTHAQLEALREQISLENPQLGQRGQIQTIANSSFSIPSRYSADSRERIRSLIDELGVLCPDCSTGVTIGGTTIIGGNPGGTPLFGNGCDCEKDCPAGGQQ